MMMSTEQVNTVNTVNTKQPLEKTELCQEDGILAEFKSITLTLVFWGHCVINNRKTVSTIGRRNIWQTTHGHGQENKKCTFLIPIQRKKRVKQHWGSVCLVLRVFSVSQVAAASAEVKTDTGGEVSVWWPVWPVWPAPGPGWVWHQMMIYPPTLSLVICHQHGAGPHRNISTSLTNYFNYTLFVPEVRCSAPKLLVSLKRSSHYP